MGEFLKPKTEKEIVVYRERSKLFGFRLPDQHRLHVNEEENAISLSTPQRGGTYVLTRSEETDAELRYYVGAGPSIAHALGDLAAEYPFPEIQHELQRLKTDIEAAGGNPAIVDAWAQGASHDSHTSRLRAELGKLRQENAT